MTGFLRFKHLLNLHWRTIPDVLLVLLLVAADDLVVRVELLRICQFLPLGKSEISAKLKVDFLGFKALDGFRTGTQSFLLFILITDFRNILTILVGDTLHPQIRIKNLHDL